MQEKPSVPNPKNESPTSPVATVPPAPAQPQSKKPRKIKAWIIALVAALVVVGGSAAAYFGVVVPNQPENKLKKAVQNLSKEQATTVKGNIDLTSRDASGSMDINMMHIDPEKRIMLADVVVNVSGIKLPVEVRYLDDTAYVKLGDLSTLKALAAGFGGAEVAPIIDMVDSKVSNQWVEIDRTFLNQATQGFNEGLESDSSCSATEITTKLRTAVDASLELATSDDAQVYEIVSTAKEDVDGESTTKMELKINEAKLAEFGKKAGEMPAVNELKKCLQDGEMASGGVESDNGTITTFNIWVSGDNQIKRVETAMEITEANSSNKVTSTVDMTMVKEAPTVEKPAGTKPIMQLIGELQTLFMGDAGSLDALNGSLSL
jgi:hypothetical protein